MSASVTRRVQLAGLLFDEPLSNTTIQHGRMLTGSALLVMATKVGIKLAGSGGIEATSPVGPNEAQAFMDLVIVALMLRFAIGLVAAVVRLRLRWKILGPEVEAELSSDDDYARARVEQIKYLADRSVSGFTLPSMVILFVVTFLVDGVTPVIVGVFALTHG
jgi:hypothetical protein